MLSGIYREIGLCQALVNQIKKGFLADDKGYHVVNGTATAVSSRKTLSTTLAVVELCEQKIQNISMNLKSTIAFIFISNASIVGNPSALIDISDDLQSAF
jgi:hypothetical protein